MAKPPYAVSMGSLKGDPGPAGPQGRPGTFDAVSAVTVPADEGAEAILSGEFGQFVQFRIPRGLPGTNAVENDEAFAAYVAADDSLTWGAMSQKVGAASVLTPGAPMNGAVSELIRGFIGDARQFGVVGDGETDDTAALNAACAAGLAKVWLPRGRYLVSGTIHVPAGTSLVGDGMGVTEIVSTTTQNPIVRAGGSASPGASIAVTSDVLPGASSVSVASAVGVTPGDYFVLTDDSVPDPAYAGRNSGEMIRVASVSGTTLTLEKGNDTGAVRGTFEGTGPTIGYTVARNARLVPLDLAEGVVISGMTIRGRTDGFGSNGGVVLEYVRRAVIRDVEVHSLGGSGISVLTSKNVVVDGCYVHDLSDDIQSGRYGYGVNVGGACSMVLVTNCQFERLRHGFTTNGEALGLPYDVTVSGSRAINTHNSSFDTHGAGFNITFSDCVSTDSLYGFSIRAHEVSMTSCEAVRPGREGLVFWENSRGALVSQFTVRKAGRYGIEIHDGVDITLRNIFVDGAHSHGVRSVRPAIQGLRILDGAIHNVGLGGSANAVYVSATDIHDLIVVRLLASSDGGSVALSRSAVSIVAAGTPTGSAVAGVRGAGMGYAEAPLVEVPAGIVLNDNVALFTVGS